MSSTFDVRLPLRVRDLLAKEARDHGFDDVSAYLAALIEANAPPEAEDPDLESQVLEGVRCEQVCEADDAFWARVGSRVEKGGLERDGDA